MDARVIGGVKSHIYVAILPSAVEFQRTELKAGYANFRRLAPKIGYHTNVP